MKARCYSISVIGLWPLIDIATHRGLDVGSLLSRVGIDATRLRDPCARIPEVRGTALWRLVEAELEDRDLGLRVLERVTEHSLDVFGYIWRASATVGHALRHGIRHARVLADTVDIELRFGGARAELQYTFLAPTTRPIRDYTVGLMVRFAQLLNPAGRHDGRVHFDYPRPADLHVHEQVLGVPVVFDAPRARIELDRHYLDAPVPGADPRLCEILERQVERFATEMPHDAGFVELVRRAIVLELSRGDASLGAVAQHLGLSARTLSRRLKEENVTHQRLLDELRHELAVRYLRDEYRSMTEVAYMLGFAHPSALNKAIRRWKDAGIEPALLASPVMKPIA